MRFRLILLICLILGVSAVSAQDSLPAATIVNDEGGPVLIEGTLTYTNLLFTDGSSEPLIILESEANFVDRNVHGVIPVESQVLGQITSDFYSSPVSYTLTLPEVPNGPYSDVDNNGETNQGVQVYGVAYWENVWGDPYLEVRDLYGYGYSSAYASMATSPDPSQVGEVIGGKYVVYAPDDQQGFPSGFGADGKLFTSDDPAVRLPQGYTVVDMDTDPFTFDRSHVANIDLIEGEASQLDDYSQMSYADGFKGLVAQMRDEYAFTEYKNVDWDALLAEFLPRFEKADRDRDQHEYFLALRDFSWAIPDGHIGWSATSYLRNDFVDDISGGLGMAIRQLDDGRVIVNYVVPGGPADQAGIELGAEISQFNGEPIMQAVSEVVPWTSPFSADFNRTLNQLLFLVRSPVGSRVTLVYTNPGSTSRLKADLTSVSEFDSWNFAYSSLAPEGASTGFELPVEYKLLDSGYAYVQILTFSDNDRLTVELWERLMKTLNDQGVPGLIVDMRSNLGGNGFLADQLAAYFFDDSLELYNSESYDRSKGEFYLDPTAVSVFYPPDQSLRYHGNIAVLTGPSCASACELFVYDMTQQNRATTIGQYPTSGTEGSINAVLLPENVYYQFPIGRIVDTDGNIIIEGEGVAPTVKVPVDESTVMSNGDPVLDAAVSWLDSQ